MFEGEIFEEGVRYLQVRYLKGEIFAGEMFEGEIFEEGVRYLK